MTVDVSTYRAGYSLAVGGVTLCGNKVLLVHRAPGSGPGADTWALPGGFVERHESVHAAVQREVFEETGVQAEVRGLIAAMNRVLDDENNTYLVFLLKTEDETVRADGIEVDDARFVILDVMSGPEDYPQTPEDWTLGADQLRWFERILSENDHTWVFVFMEHLVGGVPGKHLRMRERDEPPRTATDL